jgi:hypothetical protein
VLYTSWHDVEDPNAFLHFVDEAAEQAHRTSAAVQVFVEILYLETLDGVTFIGYTPDAST